MKTISVQLFLCVTGLMVVVALTGCTKEGPAGPQGPPGVGRYRYVILGRICTGHQVYNVSQFNRHNVLCSCKRI